jgi:hypothetical protein
MDVDEIKKVYKLEMHLLDAADVSPSMMKENDSYMCCEHYLKDHIELLVEGA